MDRIRVPYLSFLNLTSGLKFRVQEKRNSLGPQTLVLSISVDQMFPEDKDPYQDISIRVLTILHYSFRELVDFCVHLSVNLTKLFREEVFAMSMEL